ncbi:NADH-ubiquinone oxidoreductase-F iron-sulfur binding region domain-containing protein [Nocardioides sp. AN3]
MSVVQELAPAIGARVVAGTPARLVLREDELSDGLAGELARGFFGRAPAVRVEDIVSELEAAGLQGRGGAGFPASIKWRSVADVSGRKVVVANGHEGEPASAKDAWLMTHRPHLVLDGLILAATAVAADRAIVYVSHPDVVEATVRAVAEVDAAGLVPAGLRLEVFGATGGYVAGEETAVCRAISGGPALPLVKPPRPSESGVDGLPTLVANVETLAHAAWIRRHGAEAFRAAGTEASPGTALFTAAGSCREGGVFEAELGTTLGALAEAAGGVPNGLRGVLMGGWFGGYLRGDRASLRCCYQEVRDAGSGLGCAAITFVSGSDDVLRTAADLGEWYEQESARQCGVCRNGTRAIRDTLRSVADGDPNPDHRANLARWGEQLVRRGACAFLDGAATLARTVAEELEQTPSVFQQRRDPTEGEN